MAAIDVLLADLNQIRGRPVGEVHQHQETGDTRADALPAKVGEERAEAAG
jgi:hypothetical protein